MPLSRRRLHGQKFTPYRPRDGVVELMAGDSVEDQATALVAKLIE